MFDSQHFAIRDALRALRTDLFDTKQSVAANSNLPLVNQVPVTPLAPRIESEIIEFGPTIPMFTMATDARWPQKPSIGGGGATLSHPFKLTAVSALQINVAWGQISGRTPVGMNEIDGKNFTVSGFGVVFAEFSIDKYGSIDSSILLKTATITPSISSPPISKIYLTIGAYSSNGTTMSVSNSVISSMWFEMCDITPLFGQA